MAKKNISKNMIGNNTWNFICLIILLVFGCNENNTNNTLVKTDQPAAKQTLETNKQHTGYKVLDFEQQAHIDFSPDCYNILDDLVNKISSKILIKEHYSQKEARQLLETIGNTINEFGITGINTSYSFNNSLALKKFCCYGFAFTYLTVAQKFNLPLFAAIIPGHIFIIWDDKENEIWWEPTDNFPSDKQFYIDHFNLSDKPLGNLYLRKLTNIELEGLIYSEAAIKADEQIKIKFLTRSLEAIPLYESGYKNRGNAKFKLGDYRGAYDDWKKVLEINPSYGNDEFYADYGAVKKELEDYKGAIEAYSHSISLNPKQEMAYIGRGVAKQFSDDIPGAISDYTKAIELDPKSQEPYHNRGIAYFEAGKYKQAISDFNFAIKNGSNKAEMFFYRASAKNKLHEFAEAIKDFDQTLFLDPNYIKAYYYRGLAKLILKDNPGGCTDLIKAEQHGDIEAKQIITQYCK